MGNRSDIQDWVLAGIVAFICISGTLKAATVTLAWDPPETYTDGRVLTDLKGYRVYSGTHSGVYSNQTGVTNSTTITLSTVQPGCSNYFAVTAVNCAGVESDFSEEIALYIGPGVLTSTDDLAITENESGTFQIRLNAAPLKETTVVVSRVSGGNRYLGTVEGSVLVFSPVNWAIPQTVTLTALYDPTKTNRTAFFEISGDGLSSARVRVSSVGSAPIALSVEDGADIDTNGIPDGWEIFHFGGIGVEGVSAADDSDRDGVANIQEYICGTDPFDSGSRPQIDIRTIDGRAEVSFSAIEAEGSGYIGKSRFYTLEQSTNLIQWAPIASETAILAHNQTVNYSEAEGIIRGCFYRYRVTIQ